MTKSVLYFVLLVALTLVLPACRQDDEPEKAEALLAEVENNYRSWSRPQGFPTVHDSDTLHGSQVEIFFNDVMKDHAVGPAGCPDLKPGDRPVTIESDVDAWPEGSIIVKEGYKNAELIQLAIMKKEADGWFFAEFDGDNNTLFSGQPDLCVGCHSGAMSDGLFSAHLNYLCNPNEPGVPPTEE